MQEHKGKSREGDEGKKVWDDRWPGGEQWSGYAGEKGRKIKRDDVPQ
jgi:hypothetical protein